MFAVSKYKFIALLSLATCFVLSACNKNDGNTASQISKENAAAITQKAELTEAKMAALSVTKLRALASTALRDQRLHSPAGNNALEYHLAIRKNVDTPDAFAEGALVDLMPYTIIAAEQAIARSDFNEATRLRDLIARVDTDAPALPRISQAILDGLKNKETLALAETRRLQEAALNSEQAALKPVQPLSGSTELAAKPITAPDTPIKTTTPMPSPAKPAVSQTIAIAPAIAPSTRNSETTPVVAKKKELVAIRTPDPVFPSDAMNRGVSGSVEVEFIVLASGEVSEVRVLNSTQRAFDRSVLSTVKRWKFGPLDEPMTVRRSFNFANPS